MHLLYIIFILEIFTILISHISPAKATNFQCLPTSVIHKTANIFDPVNPSDSIKSCVADASIESVTINFHSRIAITDTVLDLGVGIRNVFINNNQAICVRITVSRMHPGIERISTENSPNCIYFNQPDQFLSYFPNLKILKLNFPKFNSIPVLTVLTKLTQAEIRNLILPSPITFDANTFNGLQQLSKLVWVMHIPKGITLTKDCFTNLPSLIELDIVGQIDRVHNFQFIHLPQLQALGLEGSDSLTIEENSFDGISQLTRISFWNSKGINRDLIRTLRFPKLVGIAIYNNNLATLDNVFYQQQPRLSKIVATSNPFHCDCNLQWVSIPFINDNIEITGTCSTPSNLTGFSITNSNNYIHCPRELSYQCFNRSFNCPNNSVCFNTRDSAYCQCDPGFSLSHDGNYCLYVNACQINNGGCKQNCLNTTYGYHCGCRDGYRLGNDKRSCLDVNECDTITIDTCHNCTNTIGAFECTCNPGYIYSAVNQTCRDQDECANDNDNNCHQICSNTVGSYTCSCHTGYRVIGMACVDVDECEVARCEQKCVNTVGGYFCSCNEPYFYSNLTNSCISNSEIMNFISSTQTILPISILCAITCIVILILIIVFILLCVHIHFTKKRLIVKQGEVYVNDDRGSLSLKQSKLDFEIGSNPLYAEIQIQQDMILETTTISSKRELPDLPTQNDINISTVSINQGESEYMNMTSGCDTNV